ncbi:hypothetical protein M427DRAFT_171034 [Gonapodya prolifera JEL478]|uniref:Calcium uniporter protein, mitochondrial n=1 Tax=Gonapodya prolifera (strain JEL478) TaxID=1344416 RepID=A0A139B068_GONPJ|nr:hypothetical protein M427DRAFT_171034 [Gonapodya prolifera JEL478]|eukprot:KXS22364.1 hypothetical protein M427DRAFT_171034 [Gonapodya prolifera JEL478]
MFPKIKNLESRLRNLDLIKRECDTLADRTSRNVGWAGFLGLATYFGVTTYLVYGPSNWDVMEPITYLCGIAFGLVAYLWFLITRSEYSYTSLT